MAESSTESDIIPKVTAIAKDLANTANDAFAPLGKGLKESGERFEAALAPVIGTANNTLQPLKEGAEESWERTKKATAENVGKVQEAIDPALKAGAKKFEEGGAVLKKTIGPYTDPVMKKVGDFAAEADEKSGGFLEKNKGLLFGGAIALFALFGMEGGFLPMAIAAISLIVGGLADDKGLFGNMLNGTKKLLGGDTPAPGKDAPSADVSKDVNKQEQKTAPGKENPATEPQKPAPEATRNADASKAAEAPAPAQTAPENAGPPKKVVADVDPKTRTVAKLRDTEPQTPPQNQDTPVKSSEPAFMDNKIRLSGGKTTFAIDKEGDITPSDKPGSMRVRVSAGGEVLGTAIVDNNGQANVLIANDPKVTLPVTDGHIDLKNESVRASLKTLYEKSEKEHILDIMKNTSTMINIDTASITPQAGLPKLASLNNGRVV
jgi:hypothetical protein